MRQAPSHLSTGKDAGRVLVTKVSPRPLWKRKTGSLSQALARSKLRSSLILQTNVTEKLRSQEGERLSPGRHSSGTGGPWTLLPEEGSPQPAQDPKIVMSPHQKGLHPL